MKQKHVNIHMYFFRNRPSPRLATLAGLVTTSSGDEDGTNNTAILSGSRMVK